MKEAERLCWKDCAYLASWMVIFHPLLHYKLHIKLTDWACLGPRDNQYQLWAGVSSAELCLWWASTGVEKRLNFSDENTQIWILHVHKRTHACILEKTKDFQYHFVSIGILVAPSLTQRSLHSKSKTTKHALKATSRAEIVLKGRKHAQIASRGYRICKTAPLHY